jgi:hypothetical protein
MASSADDDVGSNNEYIQGDEGDKIYCHAKLFIFCFHSICPIEILYESSWH